MTIDVINIELCLWPWHIGFASGNKIYPVNLGEIKFALYYQLINS